MLRRTFYLLLAVWSLGWLACSSESAPDAQDGEHEEEHSEAAVVTLSEDQAQLMNIEVDKPQRRQLEGYVSAPARVEAIPTRIADVGTLISGRVREIYVAEGQRVKKGQVLLEIQGLEIGEIKGEYIRTRAALESARANFERQKKLLQENIAAKRAYIEAQAAYQEAKAAFSAADQKLHSIGITDAEAQRLVETAVSEGEHQISSTAATLKIYSPISGIVGKTSVKVGQQVDPDTDIMEVVDSRQVWVVADIYEKNLATVKPGQRVEVITEAYPSRVFSGTLEFMSPVVDEQTRTVKVRTTIDNPEGLLKPEMFATMRIFSSARQESVVVPEAAVQNDGEIDFVFVQLEEDESEEHSDGAESNGHNDHETRWKFKKVPVQVGLTQDGMAQIVAGLTGQETIVVQGAFFLKSEMMKESFGEHGH